MKHDSENSIARKGISRRMFLGGAATAALAAASTGLGCAPKTTGSEAASKGFEDSSTSGSETALPNFENLEFHPSAQCDPSFVSNSISDSEVKQTKDVDVVICGAGMAGATAAASCAQQGLSVLVLEKGSTFAFRGSEIGAIGDKAHEAAGVEIDKDKLLHDALSTAHYRASRNVWKTYIDRSGEAMNWAMETSEKTPDSQCGEFKVVGQNTEYEGVMTWCSGVRVAGGTQSFVAMMISNAEQNGAEILYNTPACQLIKSDAGAITGVIAKTDDGYMRCNASKGVVLATGGYDNNWSYLTKTIRPRDLAVNAWINPTLTESGDGHLMAIAIGAAEDDYPHILMNDPAGSTAGKRANGAIFAFPRVNIYGERFINESLSFEYITNALMYQPKAKDYVLLSGDIMSAFDTMKGVIPWTAQDMYDNCKDVLIQADSIEELAQKIEVDADSLKKTVERYNEFCKKGVDEDFGKNSTTLLPMDEAPYYAIEESGSCLTTVSGLKITEKSEVLSTSGEIIPGLYALGNTSGSMFFGTYPHHISAVSHGRCLCFGYLIGRTLAGLE